jgi:hypothetical protein
MTQRFQARLMTLRANLDASLNGRIVWHRIFQFAATVLCRALPFAKYRESPFKLFAIDFSGCFESIVLSRQQAAGSRYGSHCV